MLKYKNNKSLINMSEENKTQGYYVYDFERNMYWRDNLFGYTEDIEDAGIYEYEHAVAILKQANLVELNTIMFHASEKNDYIFGDKKTELEKKPRPKKELSLILSELSKENYETNPYSIVENTLFNEGYYFKTDQISDVYVSYGESKRLHIELDDGNELALILYRKTLNNNTNFNKYYELNAYMTNDIKSQQKNKSKIKNKI